MEVNVFHLAVPLAIKPGQNVGDSYFRNGNRRTTTNTKVPFSPLSCAGWASRISMVAEEVANTGAHRSKISAQGKTSFLI